ncbi:MAG: hypothetical protein P8J17_02920 [Halioglobus sp.]|nr:hypothetical protein [Halioglobus sp.]
MKNNRLSILRLQTSAFINYFGDEFWGFLIRPSFQSKEGFLKKQSATLGEWATILPLMDRMSHVSATNIEQSLLSAYPALPWPSI